jgi:hypothetical protein
MSHYCLKTIKSFGFTPKMIEQYLGEPKIVKNPYYKSSAPMKLWDKDLVDKVRKEKENELQISLAKRAKASQSRDKRKSAKRSLLGFYLENYSYQLDEYSACGLVETAFKTGAIAVPVFKSYDLTINLLAGYLADEEEARIRKEYSVDESVYTRIYTPVKNALLASDLVFQSIKKIQNIVGKWEREEQEKAEKAKLEHFRKKLIQQAFFDYIEENFNTLLTNRAIEPSFIKNSKFNASGIQKERYLKRCIQYVWMSIQRCARQQNPNFANTRHIQDCGQFYEKILSYVNTLLHEKNGVIR